MAAQFELTDEGVVTPTEQALIDRFASRQLAEVDGLLEVHDQSINGQQNAIFGASLMEVAELVVDLVAGLDPDTATGFLLRAICALTGVTQNAATYSTVALTLSLDASKTVPAGSEVSVDGNSDAVFVIDADVTSTTADGYPATATAKAAGPVFAPAGTITVIDTTVAGWTGVTNAADAVLGLAEETPEALRARRVETLVAQGGATLDAIVADLLGVSNVTDVRGFENVSYLTDGDGMPPKSFEAVAVGGTDAAIAASIWKNKPAGIEAHGSTSEVVEDAYGYDHTVGLTRPAAQRLYVAVLVTETESDDAPDEATISAALVAAVEDKANPAYFGIGLDVYSARLLCVVLDQDDVKNAQINVGWAALGSFDTDLNSQVLAVGSREQATLDTPDITYPGP